MPSADSVSWPVLQWPSASLPNAYFSPKSGGVTFGQHRGLPSDRFQGSPQSKLPTQPGPSQRFYIPGMEAAIGCLGAVCGLKVLGGLALACVGIPMLAIGIPMAALAAYAGFFTPFKYLNPLYVAPKIAWHTIKSLFKTITGIGRNDPKNP